MRTEFQAAIAQLIHEKGLPQDVVMEAVANALLAAYRKTTDGGENVRIEVARSGDVHVWANRKVVAQAQNTAEEISLAEAQQIDPHAALGQYMEVDSPQIFNRIPAQTAKQIILQRIREAEQDYLFESFKDRIDDMVMGTIIRREPDPNPRSRGEAMWILDLGKIEGALPYAEQVHTPAERLRVGQRLRVYVYDLKRGGGRGVLALVSRTHRNIIKRLFELEVPEIFNGQVEVKAIAREPGSRSKVAVWARQENIDPIGACVGVRGTRINNVVNELGGEKVDIILWDPDPEQFVANALSPVKPLKVELREADHTALVTVPERQLSLAIGKDGQNARLAARLTGWRIDVLRPSENGNDAAPEQVEVSAEPEPEVAQLESAERVEG
ncbi:MAG: Transcription termination protein NusA [Ktedonobacterales bacterium]|jgi:N utilization substance protein A|nr:MAG: Transcription termination protein NusA [Ktedonobacterales bacterium]